MEALRTLLNQYRHRGLFPTYQQLADIAGGSAALQCLLTDYREGAAFPTYPQLAALAFA